MQNLENITNNSNLTSIDSRFYTDFGHSQLIGMALMAQLYSNDIAINYVCPAFSDPLAYLTHISSYLDLSNEKLINYINLALDDYMVYHIDIMSQLYDIQFPNGFNKDVYWEIFLWVTLILTIRYYRQIYHHSVHFSLSAVEYSKNVYGIIKYCRSVLKTRDTNKRYKAIKALLIRGMKALVDILITVLLFILSAFLEIVFFVCQYFVFIFKELFVHILPILFPNIPQKQSLDSSYEYRIPQYQRIELFKSPPLHQIFTNTSTTTTTLISEEKKMSKDKRTSYTSTTGNNNSTNTTSGSISNNNGNGNGHLSAIHRLSLSLFQVTPQLPLWDSAPTATATPSSVSSSSPTSSLSRSPNSLKVVHEMNQSILESTLGIIKSTNKKTSDQECENNDNHEDEEHNDNDDNDAHSSQDSVTIPGRSTKADIPFLPLNNLLHYTNGLIDWKSLWVTWTPRTLGDVLPVSSTTHTTSESSSVNGDPIYTLTLPSPRIDSWTVEPSLTTDNALPWNILSLLNNEENIGNSSKLRQLFHQHPELPYQEYITTHMITKELQANGVTSIYPYKHKTRDTGLIAVIQGEAGAGPCIAFCTAIDGTPIKESYEISYKSVHDGISHHICHNDSHIVTLLTLAKLVTQQKQYLKGAIKLIFYPGSITFSGAKDAIESHILEETSQYGPAVDFIYGFNFNTNQTCGKIDIHQKNVMAKCKEFEITIDTSTLIHDDNDIPPLSSTRSTNVTTEIQQGNNDTKSISIEKSNDSAVYGRPRAMYEEVMHLLVTELRNVDVQHTDRIKNGLVMCNPPPPSPLATLSARSQKTPRIALSTVTSEQLNPEMTSDEKKSDTYVMENNHNNTSKNTENSFELYDSVKHDLHVDVPERMMSCMDSDNDYFNKSFSDDSAEGQRESPTGVDYNFSPPKNTVHDKEKEVISSNSFISSNIKKSIDSSLKETPKKEQIDTSATISNTDMNVKISGLIRAFDSQHMKLLMTLVRSVCTMVSEKYQVPITFKLTGRSTYQMGEANPVCIQLAYEAMKTMLTPMSTVSTPLTTPRPATLSSTTNSNTSNHVIDTHNNIFRNTIMSSNKKTPPIFPYMKKTSYTTTTDFCYFLQKKPGCFITIGAALNKSNKALNCPRRSSSMTTSTTTDTSLPAPVQVTVLLTQSPSLKSPRATLSSLFSYSTTSLFSSSSSSASSSQPYKSESITTSDAYAHMDPFNETSMMMAVTMFTLIIRDTLGATDVKESKSIV